MDENDKWPLGVTFYALACTISAFVGWPIVAALAGYFAYARPDLIDRMSKVSPFPLPVLILGLLLLWALSGIAGVGLMRRKEWGWWTAGFMQVYGVFRNVSAILLPTLMGVAAPPGHSTKYRIRITVNLVLLGYFFSPKVFRFFGLENSSRLRALLEMVAAGFAISAIFEALMWFLDWKNR
ncbi:MAG: hypothetical protein U0836_02780 [Pirellulales bacterium]